MSKQRKSKLTHLKKARDEHQKEIQEHNIVELAKKDPQTHQKTLIAQEGLDETYAILTGKSTDPIPCAKLKLAKESWQEEIAKYWKFIVLADAFKKGTPTQDMYRAIQKAVEDAYAEHCYEVDVGE